MFTQTKVNFEINFAFRDQGFYTPSASIWEVSTGLDYSFSGLCNRVMDIRKKIIHIVVGLSFVNCRKQNYEDNILM